MENRPQIPGVTLYRVCIATAKDYIIYEVMERNRHRAEEACEAYYKDPKDHEDFYPSTPVLIFKCEQELPNDRYTIY